MIIVKISGGLGNQLFQYSFGRYLAIKHNVPLKLDLQLNIKVATFTPRSFGLSKFNLEAAIASPAEVKKFRCFSHGIFARFERKLIEHFPLINKKVVIEKPFIRLPDVALQNGRYYDGYFQSEVYFKPIEEQLREELQLNLALNSQNKSFLYQIINNISVSLHIRRGDYLSIKANSSIFNTCSLSYYQAAVARFKALFPEAIFFIFSDDIAWAKENFKGADYQIVDVNSDDPHADLYLMSHCKHHITANSSFSWWGAWLNQHKDKQIITPASWYKDVKLDQLAIASILPGSWIKLLN